MGKGDGKYWKGQASVGAQHILEHQVDPFGQSRNLHPPRANGDLEATKEAQLHQSYLGIPLPLGNFAFQWEHDSNMGHFSASSRMFDGNKLLGNSGLVVPALLR